MPATAAEDKVVVTYKFEADANPPTTDEVIVHFQALANGLLTVTDATNQNVQNEGKIAKNSTITIKAEPAQGYELDNLKVNGKNVKGSYNAATKTVTYDVKSADVYIVATFKQTPPSTEVTVKFKQPANGTLSVADANNTDVANGGKVAKNTSITIKAEPAQDYELDDLQVNGVSIKATYNATTHMATYAVQEVDVTIVATFKSTLPPSTEEVTVKYQQPANGTLSVTDANNANVANDGKVKKNTSITIKAEPAQNYELDDLQVNGVSIKATYNATTHMATYAVKEVDVTIVATFKVKGTAVETTAFATVNLLPNPCTDVLRVNDLEMVARYEVLNPQGVVLLSGRFTASEGTIVTDRLAAGLYLLRLVNAEGVSQTFRFVKQ